MSADRTIQTDRIKQAVIELIKNASFRLSPEIIKMFSAMKESETLERAAGTLEVLLENAEIAGTEKIPLCQDCGNTILFLEIGQELSILGDNLLDAVNAAVAEAYEKLYLRKSIVGDPLERINTKTNTPAVIHTEIVPGDRLKISCYLKGGGSENMTALRMFRPTASIEEIIDFIEESVITAGPNPCPPLFLGMGIGGSADAALLNSKKAVLRDISEPHENPYYAELEKTIKNRLNKTGIGPLGFGGISTVAKVYIKTAPTHIATLPVALNMQCHSHRFEETVI